MSLDLLLLCIRSQCDRTTPQPPQAHLTFPLYQTRLRVRLNLASALTEHSVEKVNKAMPFSTFAQRVADRRCT